jgi:hypothetical protein
VPLRTHADDWALHSVKLVSSDPTAAPEGSDAPALASSFGGYALCTFNLGEKADAAVGGIVEEEKWVKLQQVKARNAALAAMLAATSGFRFFKIAMTGPDGSGSSTLSCSGLEFFGRAVLRAGPVLRLLHAAAAAKHPQLGAVVRTLRVLRLWCRTCGPGACPPAIVSAVEKLAAHTHAEVKAEVWRTLELVGPRPAIEYESQTLIYACQGDAIDPVRPASVRGTPPRQFSIHPPLPAGLEIIEDKGIVWGSPSEACRRTSHTVRLKCASGEETAVIEVHVLPRLIRSGAVFRYHEPKLVPPPPAADAGMPGDESRHGWAMPEPPASTSLQGGPGSVGLIRWLSTSGFRREWSNPAACGTIKLSSSDWMTDLEFVVGDAGRLSSSHGKKDAWFALELPRGLWLLPHRYSLRHGCSSSANALRSWELQGSADGEHWVCLRSHVNDSSLDARFAVGTWGVGYGASTASAAGDLDLDATGVHRFFRVLMTGINSSKGRELRCSGFELYGEVFVDHPVDTMASPLWYMRNWALDSVLNALLLQRARMMGGGGGGGGDGGEDEAPGAHVPSFAATVVAMRRELRVEAAGFKEQVATMATGDSEPDLQVTALGTMSILSATAKDADASPPEWIAAALGCLEAPDALVREAALVALESLVPPADPHLISSLLPRVYAHHLRPPAGGRWEPAAGVGGGSGLGEAGRRGGGMLGAKPAGQSLKDAIIPAAAPSRPWRQSGIGSSAPPAAAGEADEAAAAASGGVQQRSVPQVLLAGMAVMTGGTGMGQLREILAAGAASHRPAYGRRRLEVSLPSRAEVDGPELWFVRDALLEVMAFVCERGDTQATAAALAFLSDPSPILRRKAASVIGKVAAHEPC